MIEGVSGNGTITSIPIASGCGSFHDYCIVNGDGYKRLGTVMTTWDANGAVHTDYSTTDLNGTTSGFTFDVEVSGSNVLLKHIITSGTWDIRIGTRIIY